MQKIAVYSPDPALQADALQLAHQLNLPFTEQADYLLLLTEHYLALHDTRTNDLPLYINFVTGKLAHRHQQLSLRKEALSRALGLKTDTQPTIIDATAGLGRDSFILAALGFHVCMIERSPIIHALLQDGMRRAAYQPSLAPIMQRMQLIHANAIEFLQQLSEKPQLIYLDPMFPERKKSALPKKEMRVFHDILGHDEDTDQLLQAALACASERVVVKRPRLAAEWVGMKPSYTLTGRSNRFDVFLRGRQ